MSVLSRTVKDKATLKLVRSYLTCGILEGGAVSQRIEGTPQGSPLSPLLSNIVLDELDKELEKRGHAYVRYADDCSIYVRSEAAAKRVAESIIEFIEGTLLLKVNRTKTKISRPDESTLLGFTFSQTKEGGWEIRISDKAVGRVREKCKDITGRSNGLSETERIRKLQSVIYGWVNYYCIAKAKSVMESLDSRIRVRLRICLWKAWKKPAMRIKQLLRLGASKQNAIKWGLSSKGCCRIAQSPVLRTTLQNKVLGKRGYKGFLNIFLARTEGQMSLF
jgi:RNA-directed DNA polymerase